MRMLRIKASGDVGGADIDPIHAGDREDIVYIFPAFI